MGSIVDRAAASGGAKSSTASVPSAGSANRRALWACGFLLLGELLISARGAAQGCGFEWVQSLPPEKTIVGLAAGDGTLVAVGEDGMALTSTDGQVWERHETGADDSLLDVTWGNGVFIAITDRQVLTSVDGGGWSLAFSSPSSLDFERVETGGGLTLVVGPSDGAIVSSDLESWWYSGPPNPKVAAWDGRRFLVITVWGEIHSSADGLVWEYVGQDPSYWSASRPERPTGAKGWFYGKLDDLEWDGSQFVYLAYTPDGQVWTSPDGMTWQLRHTLYSHPWNFGNSEVLAPAGRIVVSGAWTFDDQHWRTALDVSSDGGATWVRAFAEGGYGFTGLAWQEGAFFAAGDGGDVLTSPDGLEWACLEPALCWGFYDRVDLYDITLTPHGLLAVGGVVVPAIWPPVDEPIATAIMRSGDGGQTWTGEMYEYEGPVLKGVATDGGDLVVAVGGYYSALTSTDGGLTWTRIGLDVYEPTSVVFGEGLFVAVGARGEIATSADGFSWQDQASGTTQGLRRVTWGDGRFVAVGDEGTVLVSDDGATWTALDLGDGSDYLFTDVVHTGERFVAVSRLGLVVESYDGLSWTEIAQDAGGFYALAYGDGFLVAVSSDGYVSADGGYTWIAHPEWFNDGPMYRVIWTGDSFFAVGLSRGIFRADCVVLSLTLDPERLSLELGETRGITALLSDPVTEDTPIAVWSSDPESVSVPPSVTVASGSRVAVIMVTGVGIAEDVTVTATLPAALGGASDSSLVTVTPPLYDGFHAIPMLSSLGLSSFVVLLAAAGYCLARRLIS